MNGRLSLIKLKAELMRRVLSWREMSDNEA